MMNKQNIFFCSCITESFSPGQGVEISAGRLSGYIKRNCSGDQIDESQKMIMASGLRLSHRNNPSNFYRIFSAGIFARLDHYNVSGC